MKKYNKKNDRKKILEEEMKKNLLGRKTQKIENKKLIRKETQ